MVDVASSVTHALDPLSVDEIAEAVRILGENEIVPDRYYFSQIELAEPPKAAVLASEAGSPNGHLDRIAKAVLIDRDQRRSLELLLSLDTGKVLDRTVVSAGQPPFAMPEIFSIETALRDHDGFQAAMARRGITDMALVWVDPWTSGVYDDEPDFADRRWVRGLVWVHDDADDDNGYAHPVENLCVLFDLHTQDVCASTISVVVPIPKKRGNYEPEGRRPDASRPEADLDITQPDGPSFTVDGNLVTWQKWQLPRRRSPRAKGWCCTRSAGRMASGCGRSCTAAPCPRWSCRTATQRYPRSARTSFDVGELNFGALANSLTLGCDCLGEIHYFDAALVDAEGKPYTLKNAICMHEEDFGVLWRHCNWRTGQDRGAPLAPAGHLVVLHHRQLRLRLLLVLLPGRHHPVRGQADRHPVDGRGRTGSDADARQLLNADGLYGPIHQHFFNFRLDLDIDGRRTTRSIEEHAEADR